MMPLSAGVIAELLILPRTPDARKRGSETTASKRALSDSKLFLQAGGTGVRDTKKPAQHRNRVPSPLRLDEPEGVHRVPSSFAKKTAAFF